MALDDGSQAVASIQSGTSIGKYEAVELRDQDSKRYQGLGVLKAVANVNEKIAPKMVGMKAENQLKIDQTLILLDGTKNKAQLGANAILSVSQAVCEASAASKKIPQFLYLAQLYGLKEKELKVPTPILNLINGGKHGAGNLDFQEFHLIPSSQKVYHEQLRLGTEIYHQVEKVLIRHGAIHSVGDEGGFAPNLFTNSDALEVLMEAIKESAYEFQKDVFIGLDVAASFFYKDGRYKIRDRTLPMTTENLVEFYRELVVQYPLAILEDPFAEDDWDGWIKLSQSLANTILVGDDLLATNKTRIQKAIKKKACQAILVKPNQIGTIAETIEVIKIARAANWKVVVSHRSGETNDDFIADFAVGVGADYAKFGAPARGERLAKYNRLLKIEAELKKEK